MADTVHLRIKRQASPEEKPYWEEFEVPYVSGTNVIYCLMEIQRNPVNAKGEKTTPVVWEQSCLEEVCGACSMVINGKARQACSALIDRLEQPITLEPMDKFPIVRDLMVDRSVMFENLKRVKAWIPIDGSYDLGPGPRMDDKTREFAYYISRCMTCGVCLQVCPQYNDHSDYIGAYAVAQVRRFNVHPTGAMNKDERLEALLGDGGIEDCGMAQNCVKACPKEIPLTTAIAQLNRDTEVYALGHFFKR